MKLRLLQVRPRKLRAQAMGGCDGEGGSAGAKPPLAVVPAVWNGRNDFAVRGRVENPDEGLVGRRPFRPECALKGESAYLHATDHNGWRVAAF